MTSIHSMPLQNPIVTASIVLWITNLHGKVTYFFDSALSGTALKSFCRCLGLYVTNSARSQRAPSLKFSFKFICKLTLFWMVIKQLVIQILNCLTFLIYLGPFWTAFTSKYFKNKFWFRSFCCLGYNQIDKINPILNDPKICPTIFFSIFFLFLFYYWFNIQYWTRNKI